MSKSEHLLQDVTKLQSLWELDQEIQVQSGAGAVNVDQDMAQALTKAFQEPWAASKLTVPSSPYKVPAGLYSVLGNTHPWPLILTFEEPWRHPKRSQWHPNILDGLDGFDLLPF